MLEVKEPIRILHMIGSLNIGGSQIMIINLYKAMDRTKIQFDFILDHPEELVLAPIVKELGAKIYTMPTFRGTNFSEVRRQWDVFFKKHPEYKILHSHVRSYASVYFPIAKKYGVKTIIHSHSTSNGGGISAFVKKILQYPLRYQADYFFGCSKEAGKWLFGERVVESDKYQVLQNAIDAEQYRYNEGIRKEYRREYGCENNKVYIHVGRFHQAKNHAFLLNLFKKIAALSPKSILVLVGDGELRGEIEEEINSLGMKNKVILLGNRNDVSNLLQMADCFLFPSAWEGLGMVAIEAQAAGLPCICSIYVPKLVAVTEKCVFLPLDNLDAWVTEIQDLELVREDTYDKIVTAGFDIKVTTKKISSFYMDIVAQD